MTSKAGFRLPSQIDLYQIYLARKNGEPNIDLPGNLNRIGNKRKSDKNKFFKILHCMLPRIGQAKSIFRKKG